MAGQLQRPGPEGAARGRLSLAAVRPSGRHAGVHLPHEDLGRLQRGHLLAAGGGEAHGVALVEDAGAFQLKSELMLGDID